MFKKMLKPIVTGMLLAVGFSLTAVPAAAFADASDAVAGTADNNVFVSQEVNNPPVTGQNLTTELPDGYAVIVVPESITDGRMIAQEVSQTNDYDAVFFFATQGAGPNKANVYSKNPELATELQKLYAENLSLGNEGAIVYATENVAVNAGQPNVPGGESGGFDATPLGITGAVVLIIAAGATAFGVSRKNKKNKGSSSAQVSNKISAVVPEKVQEQLRKLNGLLSAHDAHGTDSLSPEIVKIVKTTQTLFERIASKQPRQASVAEVEYVDKFTKLVSLLGTDNYLDIVDNPDQWDDPHGRIAKIREATTTTRNQINENIKQINASKDLEFQVALGSLIEDANAPTIKDIFKD